MKKQWLASSNITMVRVSDNKEWEPSVTQPDESMTIREILHRVSQGMTTGLADNPNLEYDEENDDDFGDPSLDPEFDKLDALAISTSDEANDLRDRVDQAKKRAKKKKDDEDFQKRVDEEIEKRKQSQPSTATTTEEPPK